MKAIMSSFLGAFSKYYYYWTTEAAFMKAVSDGDAVTVMQDGTVDADLSRLSLRSFAQVKKI